MIINLTEPMFAPIHIRSNFHITLSSKPYLPTIKLEGFLLNYKGCSILNMFGVGRDWRVISHGVAIKNLKLSLLQIYNYLQLIKGPQRKMGFINIYMDGVRMGVMKAPYL